MNKKKIVAIISVSVVIVLLLVGVLAYPLFFGNREVIAEAKNTYDVDYVSFCSYEHDETISIDGVLDEDEWKGKKWFSNTFLANVKGSLPVMKVTGFTTERGVYVASTVSDSNLVDNGQKSKHNSIWEFYLTASQKNETKASDGLYSYPFVVDMTGDSYSTFSNFARAVVVEGDLNSGKTEGATIEMFVPWQIIGINPAEGIPSEFGLMPTYYAVFEGQTKTTPMAPTAKFLPRISDYYMFDDDGYTNADREGAIVGDTKFGFAKTPNWDISQEAEGIVRSSIGTDFHKIFFTQEYGKNFILETTIIPVKSMGTEATKTAGFLLQGIDGVYYSVFLDMKENLMVDSVNKTKNVSKYQLITLHNLEGGAWTLKSLSGYNSENTNATKQEGVKLTVVKYGGQFWYFADGKFLTCEDQDFMDVEVIPGLYSIGTDAIYKDYSCTSIDNLDALKNYLNKQGVYYVEAKAGSAGGSVKASTFTVKKGDSYDITITSKPGYVVSSITVNGVEKINDAKKKAVDGVYTVTNAKGNQEVVVKFEKCDGYIFSGNVKNADGNINARITLYGQTNRLLRYEIPSQAKAGFKAEIPAGTYRIDVEADNHVTHTQTIKLTGDMKKTFTLKLSEFPKVVKVNNKQVISSVDKWDLSKEGQRKVSTSYQAGGKMAPLYYGKTGKDFVMQATINYTTNFVPGRDYQPDLMGGFVFSDGTNTGWIVARDTGIVTTDWKFTNGIVDYNMLRYPTKNAVNFSVAKKGDVLNFYVDGELIGTRKWSEIAPKIDAKSELALGFYMVADKEAEIEFSNYSIQTGTTAATKYINEHVPKDELVDGSSIFAKTVIVNGTPLKSMLRKWDLSDIANNKVSGSYDAGTSFSPLYFIKHGKTALIQTTVEYTTEIKQGQEYQPDMFGGFTFHDGKNSGWIMANRTGIAYTGWKFEQGLYKYSVLSLPEQRSVKLTLAVQDDYIYIYFDDTLTVKKKVSEIVSDAKKGTELAIGLLMHADKTSDIRFSNTSIQTGAAVGKYIDEKTPKEQLITGSSIFAESVIVNGKLLQSATEKWDLTDIANNKISGSYDAGTSFSPLYFIKHGKTALIQTTVEYTTEIKQGQEYQPDLFGGFTFHDGKNSGWIMANRTGIAYTGWQWEQGLYDPVLTLPEQRAVKLTLAVQDDYIYIFFDDLLTVKKKVSEIVPGAKAGTELAIGLIMHADKTSDIRFSNTSATTNSKTVEEYINLDSDKQLVLVKQTKGTATVDPMQFGNTTCKNGNQLFHFHLTSDEILDKDNKVVKSAKIGLKLWGKQNTTDKDYVHQPVIFLHLNENGTGRVQLMGANVSAKPAEVALTAKQVSLFQRALGTTGLDVFMAYNSVEETVDVYIGTTHIGKFTGNSYKNGYIGQMWVLVQKAEQGTGVTEVAAEVKEYAYTGNITDAINSLQTMSDITNANKTLVNRGIGTNSFSMKPSNLSGKNIFRYHLSGTDLLNEDGTIKNYTKILMNLIGKSADGSKTNSFVVLLDFSNTTQLEFYMSGTHVAHGRASLSSDNVRAFASSTGLDIYLVYNSANETVQIYAEDTYLGVMQGENYTTNGHIYQSDCVLDAQSELPELKIKNSVYQYKGNAGVVISELEDAETAETKQVKKFADKLGKGSEKYNDVGTTSKDYIFQYHLQGDGNEANTAKILLNLLGKQADGSDGNSYVVWFDLTAPTKQVEYGATGESRKYVPLSAEQVKAFATTGIDVYLVYNPAFETVEIYVEDTYIGTMQGQEYVNGYINQSRCILNDASKLTSTNITTRVYEYTGSPEVVINKIENTAEMVLLQKYADKLGKGSEKYNSVGKTSKDYIFQYHLQGDGNEANTAKILLNPQGKSADGSKEHSFVVWFDLTAPTKQVEYGATGESRKYVPLSAEQVKAFATTGIDVYLVYNPVFETVEIYVEDTYIGIMQGQLYVNGYINQSRCILNDASKLTSTNITTRVYEYEGNPEVVVNKIENTAEMVLLNKFVDTVEKNNSKSHTVGTARKDYILQYHLKGDENVEHTAKIGLLAKGKSADGSKDHTFVVWFDLTASTKQVESYLSGQAAAHKYVPLSEEQVKAFATTGIDVYLVYNSAFETVEVYVDDVYFGIIQGTKYVGGYINASECQLNSASKLTSTNITTRVYEYIGNPNDVVDKLEDTETAETKQVQEFADKLGKGSEKYNSVGTTSKDYIFQYHLQGDGNEANTAKILLNPQGKSADGSKAHTFVVWFDLTAPTKQVEYGATGESRKYVPLSAEQVKAFTTTGIDVYLVYNPVFETVEIYVEDTYIGTMQGQLYVNGYINQSRCILNDASKLTSTNITTRVYEYIGNPEVVVNKIDEHTPKD